MPVTRCRLDRNSDTADFNERNLGTYKLQYVIDSDSLISCLAAANQAQSVGPNPLPTLWSSYSFLGDVDLTSYFRQLSVKRHQETQNRFIADLTYQPLGPTEEQGIQNGDPLLRPPVWEGDGETYTALVERDNSGNAILNAAGKPFDPTLEREETRCVAVATMNYASLSTVFGIMAQISNAVNVVPWRGRPARTVLCKDPRPLPHRTEGSITYVPMSARFVLRENGKTWDDELLEQGGGALQNAGDFSSFRADPEGDLVLLNADGTEKTDGVGMFTTKRTYREVDFFDVLGF